MQQLAPVSILMSVYNAADTISSTIQSILQQSSRDYECIIINDGSSDRTAEILEQFRAKDPRIIVLSQQQKGLAAALNRGLFVARGKYIVRQDADDISLPDRFEKQLAYIERTRCDIVGSYSYLINEKGNILKIDKRPDTHEAIARRLLIANCILHPTVMFKKESVLRIGGYNEEYEFSQDYDLYLRGLRAGLKYGCIPEPLVKIRHRSGASSVKNRRRQLLFALSAQANHFAHQKQFSFYSVYCILTHIAKLCIPFWIRSARVWIRNRR